MLYNNSVSCVRTGGTHSSWFKIEAGVRQGRVLAPDSFATGMDWLLDRTVESCSISVAFGQSSFTDLDFADDVSLLAELLQLLVPILETTASEAASLGFEVNWQKTKVQALGCRDDMPLTIKVQGQDVMVVEEFVYLGSLIHSSTGSTCVISRRSAIDDSCCHEELRKSDLEVTARHLNEVEAVQHVHLTDIPVWFGLLGNI